MWIKMLRDQVGPDGIFLKGQTVSLPQKMIEKLDSDSYVQVEVDDQAMEQMGVEERLRHLGAELVTIDAAIKSAKDRLKDLYNRRKIIHAKVKLTENEIEGIAVAKTETEAKVEMEAQDEQSQASEPAETERQNDKAADEQGDSSVSEG